MLKPLLTFAAVFLACLAPQGVFADTCDLARVTCIETGTVMVAGLRIENACLRVRRTETCTRTDPVNSCALLPRLAVITQEPLQDGECLLTEEVCTRSVAGVCDSHRRTYECWNGPEDADPATLVSRTHLNFAERIANNCQSAEEDANCTLERTTVTQGAATRSINLMSISRNWWAQERRYDCTNNAYEDTCARYANNPICVEQAETCLVEGPGGCEYAETEFDCESDASFNASCEPVSVCVGETCEGIEQEVNTDYPRVAAWLTMLNDAARDNDCDAEPGATGNAFGQCDEQLRETCRPDTSDPRFLLGQPVPLICSETLQPPSEPQVFQGRYLTCGYNVISNCCDGGGGIFGCSAQEVELRSYVAAQTDHYLETYCSQRFLGFCIKRRRAYCVYNGKFARVFQEQVDLQTGAQFPGRYAQDPCPALTIAQLETLDVDQMDFSEVFGDMLDQTSVPIEELLHERLRTRMGVFERDVQDNFD